MAAGLGVDAIDAGDAIESATGGEIVAASTKTKPKERNVEFNLLIKKLLF